MKNRISTFGVVALMLIAPLSVMADEKITTTDGRVILLKSDGTYKIETETKAKWNDYVSVESALFRHTERDFSKVIDYMPNFRNKTKKTIVGIEFTTTFKNSFGKTVKVIKGTFEQKIGPKALSKNRMFYAFKNNQFIDGETYDKLLTLVTEKTGKQVVVVNSIVFKGGELLKF